MVFAVVMLTLAVIGLLIFMNFMERGHSQKIESLMYNYAQDTMAREAVWNKERRVLQDKLLVLTDRDASIIHAGLTDETENDIQYVGEEHEGRGGYQNEAE